MEQNPDKNITSKTPKEGVLLSVHTTMKVGGPAMYFLDAESTEDVRLGLSFAKQKNLPFFVLGGGSNTLVPDEGFFGVVIKIKNKGIEETEDFDIVTMQVAAGESWDDFVKMTTKKNYFGIENLSGIPGTVGASVIQNIGAYGAEVREVVKNVKVFDTEDSVEKILTNKECLFGYRESVFKKKPGKYIVLSVEFVLSKEKKFKIAYKDLELFFAEQKKAPETSEEVRSAVLSIRAKKFPDLNIYGTAGSFFKNALVSKEKADELKKNFPDLPVYEMPGGVFKISTAFVLDKVCGLRDYKEGAVGLFKNQTLVLVNYGGASSEEIVNFKEKVKDIVLEKTGVVIEEEVVLLANVQNKN